MKKFENNENVKNLISTALDKLKGVIETANIVGEKIVTDDGTTIFPVSKVTVGYVVGGGEYADVSSKKTGLFPIAGGNSGGMSVTPVGFIVEKDGAVNFINVENKDLYQTFLNLFNTFLSKMRGKNEEN